MKSLLNSPSFPARTLLFALLTLTAACSGNKIVVTTDGSADYQSARQLPTLKKTGDSSANNPSPAVTEQAAGRNGETISTSVVQISDRAARLNIDADIDSAWEFLLDDLRDSEVTLQGRNKTANQMEIGCGSIDDGASDTEEGWTIFDNEVIHEYCILQLNRSRNATQVSVMDRRGEEVSSADAMSIFNKILNK